MRAPRTFRHRSPLSLLLGLSAGAVLLPADRAAGVDERRLSFYHTHTHETLTVMYARGGEYLEGGLIEINDFLSDFRTGESTAIDPELLDLIYDLRQSVGGEGTYQVISAYRSPKTNDMLRSNGSGVAKNSHHVLGKAIDVRLTDVDTKTLHDAAIALERGGVGYYQQSDFVHVDTGRVRRW